MLMCDKSEDNSTSEINGSPIDDDDDAPDDDAGDDASLFFFESTPHSEDLLSSPSKSV